MDVNVVIVAVIDIYEHLHMHTLHVCIHYTYAYISVDWGGLRDGIIDYTKKLGLKFRPQAFVLPRWSPSAGPLEGGIY